jgi:hypothetical protein
MSKNPEYIAAWKDYRNRRKWWYIIWLGGTVLVILIGYSLSQLLQSDIPFYICGSILAITFIVASWRLSWFKCPRCHKWFFNTWWYHNQFVRRCVHCGLPKWCEENIDEANAA